MNEQPTIDQLADMSKLCALIGSVSDSNLKFQALLYKNTESFLAELSESAGFETGFCFADLSLFEFVKILTQTIEQFNAPQQDSISVPASNPVEGQLIYAGVNSSSLKVYEKGYAAADAAIRFELSTKSGDNL